jgi:hypothetical protein
MPRQAIDRTGFGHALAVVDCYVAAPVALTAIGVTPGL